MKLICTLIAGLTILLFSFTNRSSSLQNRIVFNGLATVIEKQIEENGYLSSNNKISDAEIAANGDIRIRSEKSKEIVFNLYELYKTYRTLYGVELIKNSIRFNFSNEGSVSLGFADNRTAQEVYESLISLIIAGKDRYLPELPLDINETVDSINSMLSRISEHNSQVRVNIRGTMIITNANMQFFNFNITDLVSSDSQEGFEVNGIEMMLNAHENTAAHNQINFNTAGRTAAYIKFGGAGDAELGRLHQLFIHLRASMIEIMNS